MLVNISFTLILLQLVSSHSSLSKPPYHPHFFTAPTTAHIFLKIKPHSTNNFHLLVLLIPKNISISPPKSIRFLELKMFLSLLRCSLHHFVGFFAYFSVECVSHRYFFCYCCSCYDSSKQKHNNQ